VNGRFERFLLLTLLLGLALGCGLGGLVGEKDEQSSPPAETSAGGEQVVATEAAPGGGEETEEIEKPEEVEEPEEEEEVGLSSISSGLQSLDSYRSYFKMTSESSTGGEETQSVLEMDMEYVRDPFAQRVVVRGGDMGLGESFESVQIGDQRYIVWGEGQCVSSSAGEDEDMDMELFEIDDAIGGLENARRVRPDETVNGVLSRHYVFDEKALAGWSAFTQAEGEMWVAVDGEYVVRYTLQAEGENPITGDEGHIGWEYEIRDANASIIIEPPADCEAAESDFPIMADAANMSAMGGFVTYESGSSFDDVLSFYQEQMVADGWSENGDAFVSSGTAMLNYTKDGRTVAVNLTESDGKVSVAIIGE
jgi:hypothetical protein